MGYELNRLMQQYGVATPTLAAAPAPLAAGASQTDIDAQLADKAAYDKYRAEYMNRLNTAPMYSARQYNTTATPAISADPLTGMYQKYLGREPDEAGLNYWKNQASSGIPISQIQKLIQSSPEAGAYNVGSLYNDVLRAPTYAYQPKPVSGGTTDGTTDGTTGGTAVTVEDLQKEIEDLRQAQQGNYNSAFGDSGDGGFARGGAVKGYQLGGDVNEDPLGMPPPAAPAVSAAPVAQPDRSAVLERMLQAYGPQQSYTSEVAAARQRSQAESEAFNNLISRHLESPESAQQSKAEMYFRLAAAFGAPTRTGNFSENLGMVGQQLAQHSRGLRESAAGKRDLMLKAQQMKMGAAKEDLNAVRALEAESMKERRAINMELVKEYVKSGQPESNAGKIAKDMGLTPGTPEYLAKVKELTDLDVQRKVGELDAKIQGLALAGQNAELREQLASRLSPKEIEMKSTLEDQVATGQQALADLRQAYSLNANSFEGGLLDRAQRAALEAAGSKDPKVVNTRVMENLLGAQGLAKLKATFGGAPTEGERAILMELEGIGAKTRDERAAIMKRTYSVLADRIKREQKRLQDISTGRYRMTEPAGGIE
jgi:hypothetical protein